MFTNIRKPFLCFSIITLTLTLNLKAQKDSISIRKPDKFSAGIGLGVDYGGFGGQAIFYPQKNIGVFFGGGMFTLGGPFCYNAGIKARIAHDGSAFDPFIVAMYGVNATAYSSSEPELNKSSYGPTFGFGWDVHKRKHSLGYWSFTLDYRVVNPETKTWSRPPDEGLMYPFMVSVGYKFTFLSEP